MKAYPNWSYKEGVRNISDHSHLIGSHILIEKPKNIPRKFQKMWLTHENFMKVVQDLWNSDLDMF